MADYKGLMLHCGAGRVDFSEVQAVDTPEATKSWVPVSHDLMVDLMMSEFDNRGIKTLDAAHALGRDGAHYFGLFEVEMPDAIGEEGNSHNLIIGLRNSHAKDFPASLVGGGRVFVCDNLCFSGEIKLTHKHTTNILKNLPGIFTMGMGALKDLRNTQEERIVTYKNHVLTPEQITLEAVKMAREQKAFTWGQARKVLAEVEKPSYDEHKSESGEFTAWTLQNAVTEALKSGPNPHTTLGRSNRLFQNLDSLTGYVSPKNRIAAELAEAAEGTDILVG